MLANLQSRLEQRFRDLADSRAELAFPVYAIEHGLSTDEVATAGDALRKDFETSRGLNKRYWLCWVCVATEEGYSYDGSEFWHSFEAAFPLWPVYGNPQVLKHSFVKFRRDLRRLPARRPLGPPLPHYLMADRAFNPAEIPPSSLRAAFARHPLRTSR